MKNFIPLILAVVLGLAAVLGIRHILAERETPVTAMSSVVTAAQDIPMNGVLTSSALVKKDVPRSAVPAKVIPWEQRELILKQKTLRVITRGDYIQWSDLGRSSGVSSLIGEGEWAVSIPFSDSAIASTLSPGDEIAIIGTFNVALDNGNVVVGSSDKKVQKRVTTTILPRARIISISGEDKSTIILSLSPEQAQLLIDAQRVANLYPALRRQNDEQNIDRLKTGMVTSETYSKLLTGQKLIELPAVPDGK
jgi:Flp pilus assembly protein CpaB